jgi:hypothetical protein
LTSYVLSRADELDQTAAMRLIDRLDEAAVAVCVTGEHEEETAGSSG